MQNIVEQTTRSLALSFSVSSCSVYMCAISPIPNLVLHARYVELSHTSFLNLKTKTDTILNCNTGVSLPSRAVKNGEPRMALCFPTGVVSY